eukprot:TRINITY_DN1339_c0_g1_i4.p1 TRINITY_DN1339_c0_g1~~TRINITY_DN1339_c0_g1_i4.p1  ORF type:complete len:175 (-),score=61.83 TRINITY_DN1339_c0_g1_i4:93-617(-)
MKAESDADLNYIAVTLLATKFFVQIVRSAEFVPLELQKICSFVSRKVEEKFPGNGETAVGAFIFLRFYNNAISVPESFGFVSQPPPQTVRRQLLLVTKVIQNLVNGLKFGEKEQFMIKFNSFIEENKPKLKEFYLRICYPTKDTEETATEVPDTYYGQALTLLSLRLDYKGFNK